MDEWIHWSNGGGGGNNLTLNPRRYWLLCVVCLSVRRWRSRWGTHIPRLYFICCVYCFGIRRVNFFEFEPHKTFSFFAITRLHYISIYSLISWLCVNWLLNKSDEKLTKPITLIADRVKKGRSIASSPFKLWSVLTRSDQLRLHLPD